MLPPNHEQDSTFVATSSNRVDRERNSEKEDPPAALCKAKDKTEESLDEGLAPRVVRLRRDSSSTLIFRAIRGNRPPERGQVQQLHPTKPEQTELQRDRDNDYSMGNGRSSQRKPENTPQEPQTGNKRGELALSKIRPATGAKSFERDGPSTAERKRKPEKTCPAPPKGIPGPGGRA